VAVDEALEKQPPGSGHPRRFTTPDGSVQLLAIGGTPNTPFSDVIAARQKAATT